MFEHTLLRLHFAELHQSHPMTYNSQNVRVKQTNENNNKNKVLAVHKRQTKPKQLEKNCKHSNRA